MVSEVVDLQDSDHHSIEVHADRDLARWICDQVGGQMDTLPADIASYVAAGKDLTWRGLPDGTSLGTSTCR